MEKQNIIRPLIAITVLSFFWPPISFGDEIDEEASDVSIRELPRKFKNTPGCKKYLVEFPANFRNNSFLSAQLVYEKTSQFNGDLSVIISTKTNNESGSLYLCATDQKLKNTNVILNYKNNYKKIVTNIGSRSLQSIAPDNEHPPPIK